jgi:hypothetical protein
MRKKSREHSGLTKADLERTAGALRILDAHAKFGLALIRGEEPVHPPLKPKSRAGYATANRPYVRTMARH